MNEKILLGAGIGLGVYLMTRPKKEIPSTQPIDLTPQIAPIKQVPSLAGIKGFPDDAWRRKEWSRFYRSLYVNQSLQDANDTIWAEWNKPDNELRKYIQDRENLIINLGSYRDEANVNQVFNITWESDPVYATWSNWWNDVEYWQLTQWRLWYIALKQKYGKTEAAKRFQNAWSFSDNWSYGINEDSMGYQGGYDCDFINFFRHEGIDVALWARPEISLGMWWEKYENTNPHLCLCAVHRQVTAVQKNQLHKNRTEPFLHSEMNPGHLQPCCHSAHRR